MNVVPRPSTLSTRIAPAMQFYEFVDQGQTNATAFVSAAARVWNSMEPVEQIRYLLGRNSDAGVLHVKLCRVTDLLQAHSDPTFECELESIGN